MSTSFRELLKQSSDTIERPKPLAAGHYVGFVKSHEFGVSRNKQTPFVRFILVPQQETEDVPEGANAGVDLSKKELRTDFYITPQSLYRLSDFLDAVLGQQPGRSLDERIPDTREARVMFQVTTRDSEDGTQTYNDVGTVVASS